MMKVRIKVLVWITALVVACSSVGVVTTTASSSSSSAAAGPVRRDLRLDPAVPVAASLVAKTNNDEATTFFRRISGHLIIRHIFTTALLVLGRGGDGHRFDVDYSRTVPIRLMRSTLLGLLASEVWDKIGPLRRLGFFRRRRWRERKEEKVTNYRRVKKHMSVPTTKRNIVETKPGKQQSHQDHLDDAQTQLFKDRRRQTFTSKEKTFDSLISESQQSTSFLSVADKERLLSKYKVGADGQKKQKQKRNQLVVWHRQWSRRRKAKRGSNKKTTAGKGKKKKKRTSISPRVMAKRKFATGFSVGHLLSPLLWITTPVGGWISICCVVAELVNWLDDKQQQQADSNNQSSVTAIIKIIPVDKEVLEFAEFLRSHTIKTILIGSMVGAAISEY